MHACCLNLQALVQVHTRHHGALSGLRLLQQPDTVITRREYKAKELVLVSVCKTIVFKHQKGCISIGSYQMLDGSHKEVHLPPAGVQQKDGDKKHAWCVPFWFVSQVDKEAAHIKKLMQTREST